MATRAESKKATHACGERGHGTGVRASLRLGFVWGSLFTVRHEIPNFHFPRKSYVLAGRSDALKELEVIVCLDAPLLDPLAQHVERGQVA